MNIFNIHTNKLDRRTLLKIFTNSLRRMDIVVVYDNLSMIQESYLKELDITFIKYDDIKDEKYDICIAYNISHPMDRISNVKSENYIIIGEKHYSDSYLKNYFKLNENDHISTYKGSSEEYYHRDNGEFYVFNNEQLEKVIVREIKLKFLLE